MKLDQVHVNGGRYELGPQEQAEALPALKGHSFTQKCRVLDERHASRRLHATPFVASGAAFPAVSPHLVLSWKRSKKAPMIPSPEPNAGQSSMPSVR